jgi:hypothetical protein
MYVSLWPDESEYVPVAQSVQFAEAAADEYVPAAHSAQEEAAVDEYFPAEHAYSTVQPPEPEHAVALGTK